MSVLVGEVGGEPLLDPDLVPPLGGDQVPDPLVHQLVGHHAGHLLHRTLTRDALCVSHKFFPVECKNNFLDPIGSLVSSV